MNTITVEGSLGTALSGLKSQAILCDAHGRALGVYSPLAAQPQLEDLQLEPPLSIAETEELRQNRTGKPLEEILQRLGAQ
ncbi:MAG TPA: hypothetical protein VFV87_13995 [Pirellulaceae bacterium]|nr:hypothetical protein [Pirellulaceae bacterium]